MFDLFEYVDSCREHGIDSREAMNQLDRERSERYAKRVEELEEHQMHTAWQQDLIDMRRFER